MKTTGEKPDKSIFLFIHSDCVSKTVLFFNALAKGNNMTSPNILPF